ncbi:unnamed protein product [Amoebophrya sp. A120]|nr:unnamed protein product [Amoebophrya sp. A120]|eukprot:GSA120T00024977001.1
MDFDSGKDADAPQSCSSLIAITTSAMLLHRIRFEPALDDIGGDDTGEDDIEDPPRILEHMPSGPFVLETDQQADQPGLQKEPLRSAQEATEANVSKRVLGLTVARQVPRDDQAAASSFSSVPCSTSPVDVAQHGVNEPTYAAVCTTSTTDSDWQPARGKCKVVGLFDKDPCYSHEEWTGWESWDKSLPEEGVCGKDQVDQKERIRKRDARNYCPGDLGFGGCGSRRRHVGGRTTTKQTERRTCDYPPCGCRVSEWSDWGPCSTSCGVGTQTRTRTQTPPESGSYWSCSDMWDKDGVFYTELEQTRPCQICGIGSWTCATGSTEEDEDCKKTCCPRSTTNENYDKNYSCEKYRETEGPGSCKWGHGAICGSGITSSTSTCAALKYWPNPKPSSSSSSACYACVSGLQKDEKTCDCPDVEVCHEKCSARNNEDDVSAGFCFENSSPDKGWYYSSNKANDRCKSPICGKIGATAPTAATRQDDAAICCQATAKCSSTQADGSNQHCRNLKDPANQSLDLGKAYNPANAAKFCKRQNCNTATDPDQGTCCKLRECQCTSPGGKTPATGAACPAENSEFCTEVDYGYHLVHDAAAGTQVAVQNECSCEGGDPAVGPDVDNPEDTCFDHGYIQCKSTGCLSGANMSGSGTVRSCDAAHFTSPKNLSCID